MLSVPFISKSWMSSSESFDNSKWIMVGIPYDGTCSFRPGTRFGPEMIRVASNGIETYSPYQNLDLDDIAFFDAGELDLPLGNRDKTLDIIAQAANETIESGKKWFGIGGEHLVTYPVVAEYVKKYPDLAVIHFDAHADLREDYLGEKLSHATVMRRITEQIKPESLFQIGIRSGTKDEFVWMRSNNTLVRDISQMTDIVNSLKNRPVFLSIDIDVLDPSIMPGTGTPEPGGFTFNEFIFWLLAIKGLNFVGADVVELSPHYDNSGISAVIAAKVVREVLLLVN